MKTLLILLFMVLISLVTAQAQWTNYQSPLFSNGAMWSLQVVDVNNVWAINYQDNIIVKTINGGQTWGMVAINDPAFSNFGLESIAVTNSNTAWLTATSGTQPYQTRIYKTTDGGLTWQHQSTAYAVTGDGHTASANYFFDVNNGVNIGRTFVSVAGSQMQRSVPEILTTNNGGATWSTVSLANLPANALQIDARSFSVVNNTIWYIGIDSNIYKSSDKGLTWNAINPGFSQQFGATLTIAFSDINNGLAASNTTLKRTTDGGATWTTVNAAGTWNAYEITAIPGTTSTYISAGRYVGNAGSYITYNNGDTWTTLETTNQHFDIQFLNPTTGWSGGVGKMFKFNSNVLGAPKEITAKNSFFIYPNPSNSIFNITPTFSDPFRLEIYDLVGNKVKQQKGNSFGKNSIDLSSEKKGIYLLHILSGEHRIIEKIVLQ